MPSELLLCRVPDAVGSPYTTWNESDWKRLLLAIEQKRCTPFLGAGASRPVLPSGAELAEFLAAELDYPFAERRDLARVAQYGAIHADSLYVKGLVQQRFEACGAPDFDAPGEPHALVADLELPVYITTNYDDFLVRALRRRTAGRELERRLCPWHRSELLGIELEPPIAQPTAARPLVFHLHGHFGELDSLVLTEDDYLDFLVRLTDNEARAELPSEMLIPPRVREAFRNSTLLFLGYGLGDTNFRVLFRAFANYLHKAEGPRHVAVQLRRDPPRNEAEERELAAHVRYLQRSFEALKVRIYWGSCAEFALELRERMEGARGAAGR